MKIKGAVYLIGNQTDGLSAETEAGNGAVLDHGTEMTIGDAQAPAFVLDGYVSPAGHCHLWLPYLRQAVPMFVQYCLRKQMK